MTELSTAPPPLAAITGYWPGSTAFSYRDEVHQADVGFGPHQLPYVQWGRRDDDPNKRTNLYPLRFVDLLATNPVYSRVATQRARLAIGDGFWFDGPLWESAQAALEGLGLADWLERAAMDASVFNATATLIHVGSGRMPVKMQHVPTHAVRVGVRHGGEPNPRAYYYSADWRQVNTLGGTLSGNKRYKVHEYRAWGSDAPLDAIRYNAGAAVGDYERVEGQELLYVKSYSPAGMSYPQPFGEAAYTAMVTRNAIIEYYRAVAENGFDGGKIITLPKQPNPDPLIELREQQELVRKFNAQHSGPKKAGAPTFIFVDPRFASTPPDVQAAPADSLDQRWVSTMQLLEQAVMTGLGVVAPEAYGVFTHSGFSNEAEKLNTALQHTYYQDVKYVQQLLTRTVYAMLEALGFSDVRAGMVTSYGLNGEVHNMYSVTPPARLVEVTQDEPDDQPADTVTTDQAPEE